MTTNRDIADYYRAPLAWRSRQLPHIRKRGAKNRWKVWHELDRRLRQIPAPALRIDNDRYEWSILLRRDPENLASKVALGWCRSWNTFRWIPTAPFIAPGGSNTPYPDPWTYSSRDYGNRVGAFRVFVLTGGGQVLRQFSGGALSVLDE